MGAENEPDAADVNARTLEVQKVIEASALPKEAVTALAILQFGAAIAKATEVDKHVLLSIVSAVYDKAYVYRSDES